MLDKVAGERLVKLGRNGPCAKSSLIFFFFFKFEDVLLVEFMYLVFTRILGETRQRQLGSLCLCDSFRVLINSFVC